MLHSTLSLVRLRRCFCLLAGLMTSAAYEFRHYGVDTTIKPGSLLLTMLVKNEADHLRRSLPEWAKVADYWVVGLDDNNTDTSDQIIKEHLGHLPGEILIVNFDGMGPTWSKLLELGLKKYPKATHGILADADFVPLNTFDKRQLDTRCSKHMFTVTTANHNNNRRLDWIYRNIPGAVVKRRTHQALEVPELTECPAVDSKGQPLSQTLIDLVVEEHTGGYQDRTPGKQERYINWLLADLDDYPEDGRTLYYLGMAKYEQFMRENQKPQNVIEESIGYFKRRIAIPDSKTSYFEERWFAMLKLGEIYERFYNDYAESMKYYQQAVDLDPERADGWFYVGQNYRLTGRNKEAFEKLKRGASLSMPERSLFQWMDLYSCLRHLELLRAAYPQLSELDFQDLVVTSRSSDEVINNCRGPQQQEGREYRKAVDEALPAARKVHDAKRQAQAKQQAKEREELAKKQAKARPVEEAIKAGMAGIQDMAEQARDSVGKIGQQSMSMDDVSVPLFTTIAVAMGFAMLVGGCKPTNALLATMMLGYIFIGLNYMGFSVVKRS